MKNTVYLAVIITLLSACSREAPAPASPASNTVPLAATVNGEAVTVPMLEVFARGRGLDPAQPEARQRALDLLLETMLLAQDARARGLTERPDVQAELALVGLQQLAGRGLSELRGDVAVDEADVRAYYEREAARTGGIELHLKHILFEDEASAMAAVERALAAGADFDALMAGYAVGGARQARDLGWGNLSQLPPELGQAALALQDGQVGPLPVRTSYGWHVFRREASRPFNPPAFEQVADGARKQLVEQRIAEHVAALRSKAKIETTEAPGG